MATRRTLHPSPHRRRRATITAAEPEALHGYEWRLRLTATWLIGVGQRATFRIRIGYLLLVSESRFFGGGCCFALTHLHGQPACTPAEIRRWTGLPCDFANDCPGPDPPEADTRPRHGGQCCRGCVYAAQLL
ncbi:DUF6000 family protein [Yinghuangia seranimata]|uniref:DUF6000 family protein n=1 Tax=Yinghuangia seranimata TaxID=408067 RepID=UPI00248C96A5|nr:DUF6000 family protein [Yinghuangia seranimata]MDI2128894.1 DUF6000 family protein [Yinghuangia seranimata]